ncbi:APC family permease [uncultured Desulfuromusa sp.]|uniref:APC family permease n=1 Tax=uncultured Desulfuromusa sp. TaxID=219183 RepID=UPI002AA88EA4|nr:APC family permease [uncultured Desulfuromusa sp.]
MKEQQKDKLGFKELVAMGVGGMVGGGIFSVLGLAVGLAGHAAPIAFSLGGIVALLTGWSYARLGLTFHSAGGSFTYMEHAYRHRNVAALGGWLLLAGYIGTLALYSYTFGVYGSVIVGGSSHGPFLQHLLASGILIIFLGLNLYSVKATGGIEDLIVIVKVLILSLFAAVGLFSVKTDHLLPVFDQGQLGMLMGAALIFVAYEGFELIPNAVNDMKNPQRDLPRAIMFSILLTIVIYILVSLVAVGNLLPDQIVKYKESALAVAAKPFLGHAGFVLIGLGALLSTASAINATLFGTARLGKVMAQDEALPCVFSIKERTRDIPWVSLCIISGITIIFVNLSDLTDISSFASSTFLLVFSSINFSAFRLRARIDISPLIPLAGLVLCLTSWVVLCAYLWLHNPRSLKWIIVSCLAIAILEFLFSQRRLFFKKQSK